MLPGLLMLIVAELLLVCWGVHACSWWVVVCWSVGVCFLVSQCLFCGKHFMFQYCTSLPVSVMIHCSAHWQVAVEHMLLAALCTNRVSTLIPLALVSSAVCVTLLLANFCLVAPGSVVQCLIVLAFVCCETTAKTSKHENRVSPAAS